MNFCQIPLHFPFLPAMYKSTCLNTAHVLFQDHLHFSFVNCLHTSCLFSKGLLVFVFSVLEAIW